MALGCGTVMINYIERGLMTEMMHVGTLSGTSWSPGHVTQLPKIGVVLWDSAASAQAPVAWGFGVILRKAGPLEFPVRLSTLRQRKCGNLKKKIKKIEISN